MAAAAAFAGPIRERPAAVGSETLPERSPHRAPPPWTAGYSKGVAGNVSHGQNSFSLKTVQNDTVRGPQVLGNFSRVFELKTSVLGLGFYLVRKTRFI